MNSLNPKVEFKTLEILENRNKKINQYNYLQKLINKIIYLKKFIKISILT